MASSPSDAPLVFARPPSPGNSSSSSSCSIVSSNSSSAVSSGHLPLYSQAAVSASPSRAVGISKAYEQRLRRYMAGFITDIGVRLKLEVVTVATATTYLHHFFQHFPCNHFDKYEVAAACIMLAGKVEEQRAAVNHVCEAVVYQRHQQRIDRSSAKFKEMNARVTSHEVLLLQCIGFNFRAQHPYSFCLDFVKKVCRGRSKKARQAVTQYAWTFLNDSLRTPLCLMYSADKVALACICLAVKWYQRDQREVKPEARNETDQVVLMDHWWLEYCDKLSDADISRMCHELLDAKEDPIRKSPNTRIPSSSHAKRPLSSVQQKIPHHQQQPQLTRRKLAADSSFAPNTATR